MLFKRHLLKTIHGRKIPQLSQHSLEFSHDFLVTQAKFVIQVEGVHKSNWNGIPEVF